jgi:hypothetical protein
MGRSSRGARQVGSCVEPDTAHEQRQVPPQRARPWALSPFLALGGTSKITGRRGASPLAPRHEDWDHQCHDGGVVQEGGGEHDGELRARAGRGGARAGALK